MKKTFFLSLLAASLSSLLVQAQQMSIPEVTISATVASTSEGGNAPGVFTVTRTIPTDALSFWSQYPMRVFYRIGGTASNGIDYQSIYNFVVIPTNADSATITITPIDDRLIEGSETVELQLISPVLNSQPPYQVGSPSNAVVTIADNPKPGNLPPMVEIVLPTNGAVFTAPANIMIFAHPEDTDGTVQTVEFFAGSRSLGTVTNTPYMSPINPWHIFWTNVPPGRYSLTALATDNQGASGVSAPVNIAVQESPTQQPVVSVVASDPQGSEIPVVPPGMGMPQRFDPAIFTVTRTGSTGFPLAVYYTISGTAQNGVDYNRLPGMVTIPTGATSADIPVAPIDDFLAERTETVTLRLEPIACIAIYPPPPECYLIGRPDQATAYILDDDTNQPPAEPPVVTIVATDPDASEIPVVPPWLDMAQRYDPGVFTVTRTGSTDNPLTVYYYTRGTAQNGIDYARLSNYVVIPAGTASAPILVDPIDDALVEAPETVAVHLRPAVLPYADNSGTLSGSSMPIIWPPPYLVGSPSNAVVTIADDDTAGTNSPPRVQIVRPLNNSCFRGPANILLVAGASDLDGSVSSVEFFEGANSLGLGTPTAILSSVYPSQFALMWSNVQAGKYILTAKATDNGGASTVSAPITIAVLVTNLPPITNTTPVVSITAIDSIASEGRFDFPTTVIAQSNLLCTTASGFSTTSTWVRLDPSLSNSVYWTNIFCGTNTATFEVRRSGSTNNPLTVYYSIQGAAISGADYVALPGSVTIPAGRRAARIVIVPIDDTLVESNETVILSLTLPTASNTSLPAYLIGTPARAGAVIIDNDSLLPPATRLTDGSFHVYLPAVTGSGYRLETSSDLSRWTSCLTSIADGSGVHYIDPDASTATIRFYRLTPEPVLVPEE